MRGWIVPIAAAACATRPMPPPAPLAVSARTPAAATGVSAQLDSIARRYWTALLDTAPLLLLGTGRVGGPLYATALGDRRFDAKLDDLSPDGHRKVIDNLAQLRAELATLQTSELSAEEQLTAEALRRQLTDADALETCSAPAWVVDQMSGPQIALGQTAQFYPLGTAKGAADLARRYGQAGRFFDQLIENLRRGLIQQRTASRVNVERVIASLDELLKRDPSESAFMPGEERFSGLPEAERSGARDRIRAAIIEQVFPGARRYRDFLAAELLPKSRAQVGLWALPGGEACYAALVAHHTGTKRTPQELHDLGLKTLSGIEAEMESVARAEGAGNAREYRARLDKNRDQFVKSEAALLQWNRGTLARAQAALRRAFGRLPRTPIETRPIEAWRAPSSPPAFYQPAPADGSRPATYYVNTLQPQTRALYNEEALCFHETVPGHHLQISLAQELEDLPEFRRHTGETAFVEGWALYTERMSDQDLHLYSGPPARFGMLGYQAWRAARLVVDTGMHALKWDRERALQYLLLHTTLSEEEAANEIDRYAVHPAQALAYMMGELELFRLREEAQKRAGDRFDLRAFHDAVLAHGAVPLASLERLLREGAKRSARADGR
ncbi:MAG TPA: DUF885 domain-containing protein [Myxococcales bacterium]|nr:DUF885 domain-containing protein [Myxococcales bacterium]